MAARGALSVLTEAVGFGGTLDDLAPRARARRRCRSCARTSSSTSTRCVEALAAGADAILLIVAALDPATLTVPATTGRRSFGLGALVEVHDGDELAIAATIGAEP